MRILMLSWEYPPHLQGGMGAHVADLVPALAAQGVEVTLLTPRWRGGDEIEKVSANLTVYRVLPPVTELSNYYADVVQTNIAMEQFAHRLWAQGQPFDLIHAHDWLVSFAAEALKKIYKTPLVATIHATERGRGRGMLAGEMSEAINGAEWFLTYEAWRVIATSRFMLNEVCSFFQLPGDKVTIIPNGVNPHRRPLLATDEWEQVRAEWVAPHEHLVYYIGRIQQEKGVDVLVDATWQVLKQDPDVKFVLAGTGALLDDVRWRVAVMHLNDRVVLPGYVNDTTRDNLYQIADLAVFPSLYEPFGIVALEAMAARCPVIVSDVGGLGEVVENNVTGLKVMPGRSDLLADAILESLHNRAHAAQMAERAYQVVCQEYSWEHIARATAELYQEIIRLRQIVPWN